MECGYRCSASALTSSSISPSNSGPCQSCLVIKRSHSGKSVLLSSGCWSDPWLEPPCPSPCQSLPPSPSGPVTCSWRWSERHHALSPVAPSSAFTVPPPRGLENKLGRSCPHTRAELLHVSRALVAPCLPPALAPFCDAARLQF